MIDLSLKKIQELFFESIKNLTKLSGDVENGNNNRERRLGKNKKGR